MYLSSSPRPMSAPVDYVSVKEQASVSSYAVSYEPSVPMPNRDEERGAVVYRAVECSGLALQPLLDRITCLADGDSP